jgi:hypothetical protein
MKAVIALSGLAGFILFGPPLLHLHRDARRVVVKVEPRVVTDVRQDVQSRCNFEAERSLSVPAGADGLVRVEAGSGSLEVVGVAGLAEVRATARACASREEFLEDLRLTSDRSGSTVRIETHYPDWSDRGGWGNRYARLDLRVEVPEGMMAEIQDSSGEIYVAGLGDLDIRDSSGEIEGEALLGNVRIDDSSGEVVVREVAGDVEIEDGSGEIQLADVGGAVMLEDGSGEIEVERVAGTVRVVRDGSGSINVDGVGGDFIVDRDGSGGITYRNVKGRVDVPRKGR